MNSLKDAKLEENLNQNKKEEKFQLKDNKIKNGQ